MPMPEESHFFTKLRIGVHHFIYPINVQIADTFPALFLQFFSLFRRHLLFLEPAGVLYSHHEALQIIIGGFDIFRLF